MNIVNFTPYSALTGGIIIGFAVAIFFYFNGRLVGISGIASNALTEERNKIDNILFLIGLSLASAAYFLLVKPSKDRLVRSLQWRIFLSLILFFIIMVSWLSGWITPATSLLQDF